MKRVSQQIMTDFHSSFLSCEKDQELILKKLFVENKPYSNYLKRLLIINTPDCLDESQGQYLQIIDKYSLGKLKEEGYISLTPKLKIKDFGEVKSYIIIEFTDFFPTSNPEFRNVTINFSIFCNTDCWELDNYKTRPIAIAGYLDGILNNTRLTGIGKLRFVGAQRLIMNEDWGGIVLQYSATHENDEDKNEIITNEDVREHVQ